MKITLDGLDAGLDGGILAVVGDTGEKERESLKSSTRKAYPPSESSVIDDIAAGQLTHQLANDQVGLLRPFLLQARILFVQFGTEVSHSRTLAICCEALTANTHSSIFRVRSISSPSGHCMTSHGYLV